LAKEKLKVNELETYWHGYYQVREKNGKYWLIKCLIKAEMETILAGKVQELQSQVRVLELELEEERENELKSHQSLVNK